MMRAKRTARVVLGVLVLAGVAICQTKAVRVHEPAQRLALVIGNAEYAENRLANPVKDAELIEATLEGLGFDDVVLETDLETLPALRGAVLKFGRRLKANDLAFFYYSGHGLQAPGGDRGAPRNYLLPTRYDWKTPLDEVQDNALSFERVRQVLDDAQLRVMVLDACRKYKLGKSDGAGGLAPTVAASGELIAYATEPDAVATDEGAPAGIYAQELSGALQQHGLEVAEVFRNVMEGVVERTEGEQHPEHKAKIVGRLYLNGRPSVVPPLPKLGGGERLPQPDVVSGNGSGAGGGVIVRPPPEVPGWKRDWQELKDIEDPALKGGVEKYIEKYKDEAQADVLVEMAKGLLAKLERLENPPRLAGSSWKSPSGMEFAWIPAGRFVMGSPNGEEGRYGSEVQHEVRISQGFWMGKYEVTQGEWESVMGSNPSYFDECGSRCPVENVVWNDVQEFIRRLNERESGSEYEYRLPTEAEWEYAARAGTSGPRYGELDLIAWWDGNSGDRTHPVGQKRANGWGLHDMLGNVLEWVADWYGAEYPSGMVTDPRGPSTGLYRVARGGSWGGGAGYVRSAARIIYSPGDRLSAVGFRLVRTK